MNNIPRFNDIKLPTPNRSISVRNIGSIREWANRSMVHTFCFLIESERIPFLQYEANMNPTNKQFSDSG